ncbi:ATP-binding protein [Tahibacter amnicola]|uniref:histidine kinase n=1 Tax=Tahibacter amnicola TaxID=2976241 RepID=A0ABY6BIX4_9GAMM|nr:ATP-binding protein [Tahibacter amnicola]UXI69966.1 ATP-binding protein [Tahibacter amnicola]
MEPVAPAFRRARCPGLVSWGLAALASVLGGNVRADDPAQAAAMAATPPGHHLFRAYGGEEGLANVSVLQLLQDRHGFIWAGTEDGLYRYDGYRFDGFGLKDGLHSTTIESLHEDSRGQLWVGTRSGLSRWNGTVLTPVAPESGLPGATINGMADGPDGLWLATAQGLYVGTPDGRYRPVPGFPKADATAVWADPRGRRLWAASWEGAPSVWFYRDGQWRRIALPPNGDKDRVMIFCDDGVGRVWARTDNQLLRLDEANQRFVTESTPLQIGPTRAYLHKGRRGDLLVPTPGGLLRLENDTWSIISLDSMVGGNRPVIEDREGSIWQGSMGLHRLLGRRVIHIYTKPEGRIADIAWSIMRDSKRRLWVTTDKGVEFFNGRRFETIPGTESKTFRSIRELPGGVLYLAGSPVDELTTYDPEKKLLQTHHWNIKTASKVIYRVIQDRSGVLWASTFGAGLLRSESLAPNLNFVPVTLPDPDPHERIIEVHEDPQGRLWIGGEHGVGLLENGKWRRFTTRHGLRSNFVTYVRTAHNGDLFIVYFEPLGFARARYVNGELKILRHYDSASPGTTDKIFVIGEDIEDRVWLGGGRGIDVLSADGHVEHFGAAEGLIGEDTASMAFLAEPNGDVWIGTSAGLVRFDAKTYRELPPRTPPEVAIMHLQIGSQSVAPDTQQVRVAHDEDSFEARFAGMSFVGEGKIQYRVRLHGRETAFITTDSRDARYSALSPGRYRFEVSARVGQRGEWGPPATFQFEITPAWWQTWWSRSVAILLVLGGIVRAVRWRLAALERSNRLLEDLVAARTGELSRANLALHGVNEQLQSEIDDRIAAQTALHQRNADLEAVNQKLAGTQNQLLQSEKMASVGQLAAGVAHEINNPIGYVGSNLGSLRRYVGDLFTLLEKYERLESALPPDSRELHELRTIKANIELDYLKEDIGNLMAEAQEGITRVRKIVSDLKDFSHLDEPEWQLADLHAGLDSTLNLVMHQIKYNAEVVKDYGNLPPIRCLPFQLNQVFLNLLINAAQAIEGRGVITLRTRCDGDTVRVEVADNGKGIAEENLHRVFDPFFTTKPIGTGTGLGLSVSYGIVQTHGGSISVHSVVGVGTTFTVRLPIDPRKSA